MLLKVVKTKVDNLVSCAPEAPSLIVPVSEVMFPLLLMPGITSASVLLALLVWFRDELALDGSSADRVIVERDVCPTLSLTNSSKLDIPMLNARSPMKLYEEPPETAQDAPQPPPMQGWVAKADANTRNKVKRMILNSIRSMTFAPKALIWWSDNEQSPKYSATALASYPCVRHHFL